MRNYHSEGGRYQNNQFNPIKRLFEEHVANTARNEFI